MAIGIWPLSPPSSLSLSHPTYRVAPALPCSPPSSTPSLANSSSWSSYLGERVITRAVQRVTGADGGEGKDTRLDGGRGREGGRGGGREGGGREGGREGRGRERGREGRREKDMEGKKVGKKREGAGGGERRRKGYIEGGRKVIDSVFIG